MFDENIDRRGTSCFKWDWEKRITGREGLLPFWVADMDFMAPPSVMETLRHRVEHGIFGYTSRPESLIGALTDWFFRRHQWSIEPGSILEVPGIVPFIHIYVQFFTNPGDAVVIQEPVYYPFRTALERNKRRIAENPLIKGEDHYWRMDLKNLEWTLDESGAKTLIFCSPHNPVGRVWNWDELQDLADLCRAKGVTVLSDEIHADLIQPGFRHYPWLTLPEDKLPRSMSLVSPTKTFNLPGLNTAWAVIPDAGFRGKIEAVLEGLGLGMGAANPLSYSAAEAAWREGHLWLDSLIEYIGKNDRRLRDFFEAKRPEVGISLLEGTYLAWLDLSALGFADKALWEQFLDAGIWLSRGTQFGRGGEGHLRINLACPRNRLDEGLKKMGQVL